MENGQTGILRIFRAPTFFARLRSYAIVVDGKKAHSIKEDETVSIPLPTGRHTVCIKIDWTKSNVVEINIETGQATSLQIVRESVRDWQSYAWSGFYVLLMLLGAIFSIGSLVGIGAALLVIHRSGRLQLKPT